MLVSFLVSNWSDILYLYVLFSKVCFFIGTSEAIEVIPSLVGNETAILLSFKPQIQHKSQNKMHKHTHTKCLIVDQPQTQFPKTILYIIFSMAFATMFAATCHLHIIISNRVRQLCLPCCLQYLFIAFIHACMLVHNTFREYMLTAPHMKCTKNFKKPRTSLVIPV